MTEKQLQKRVRYWTKLLGLQGWEIRARFASRSELEAEEGVVLGECHSDRHHLTLGVSILHPREWGEDLWGLDPDLDVLIVHELLHVFYSTRDLPSDTLEHVMIEQGNTVVARALVALDRKAAK